VQSRVLLVICQLVRIQEALFESRIREPLRRMLHHIEDKADGLLSEGQDQVIIPPWLPVDPVQAETVFSQHKRTHRFVRPAGWQLDTVKASGPGLIEVDEVLSLYFFIDLLSS
jgi:hypothetical protein